MLTMRILTKVVGGHALERQLATSLAGWKAKLARLNRLTRLFSHHKDARVLGATSLLLIVRQHLPPPCRQSDLNERHIFERSNALELLRSGFSILRCILGWRGAMMEDTNLQNQSHKDGVLTATRMMVARHVQRAARQNERTKALLFYHGIKAAVTTSASSALRAMERNFVRASRAGAD